MPSPFPGMNPYLEHPSVWHDFHESFMPLAREALSSQVLPRYFVKIDEHLYVHELAEESRRLVGRADLSVTHRPSFGESARTGAQLLTAPAEVTVPEIDIESISYLQVLDRETRQVVTVVELLSPSNKLAGSDRDQYVSKSRQLTRANVNLVEIDLLRCGSRTHWVGMSHCDYSVVVSRPEQSPKAGLWPIRLAIACRRFRCRSPGRCRCSPRPAAATPSHLRFGWLRLLHLRPSARACPVA